MSDPVDRTTVEELEAIQQGAKKDIATSLSDYRAASEWHAAGERLAAAHMYATQLLGELTLAEKTEWTVLLSELSNAMQRCDVKYLAAKKDGQVRDAP